MSAQPELPAATRIAAFVAKLSDADVPSAVREAAALHVLDTLGCGIAAVGARVAPGVRQMAEVSAANGACSIFGQQRRVAPESAAFANGALCHALDFDDTHGASICHISTVVVPAALAVAEERRSGGAELLTAIIAGNETIARIGAVAAPAYMHTGFHHTGVCGAFGATVAAARLLQLDTLQTQHALGICGSLASGSLEFLADGSTAKIVNAGAAAQAGQLAARLALHGGTGPASVLEGRYGLFSSYFGLRSTPPDWLVDLGSVWETPNIAFKAYPACHFIHASLDAVREAGDRLGVTGRPGEVDEVTVAVPAPALPLVLEPRDFKIRPRTAYEGKFSLQYSVAHMLATGRVGVRSYASDAIHDEHTLALAARVTHRVAEFGTYPAAFPARVTVRAAGATATVEVPYQRGSAERPMTDADVAAKFADNVGPLLDSADAEQLRDRVLGLDRLSGVDDLLDPLRSIG